MDKRSTDISMEGAIKSFKKFTPPPWESIKESTHRRLILLVEAGSLRILLKILGVNGTWFFPSTVTQIVLLFESNLWAHHETNSPKSKTLGMQPTFTKPVIHILLFCFCLGVRL
jgi:hypothetical protein